MTSRFIPLGERVLIQLDTPEEKTAAGLFLPENARHSMTGVVLGIGPRVKQRANLGVGDSVVVSKYAGVAEEVEPGIVVVPEAALIARTKTRPKVSESAGGAAHHPQDDDEDDDY